MPAASFITLVTGLPRSGTSMMMGMLQAGGLRVLADGAPGGYDFEPVKRTRHDCSWLAGACGTAVRVTHALLRYLPAGHEYRLIVMRRNPDEVMSEQAILLRRMGVPEVAIPPDRLAEAFLADLEGVLRELRRRPEFRILEVDYRECVANPAAAAATVNSFLDGGLVEVAAAAVPHETATRKSGSGIPDAGY